MPSNRPDLVRDISLPGTARRGRFWTVLAALLFCLSLAYFAERGPYRAICVLNSYDFSSVYAAARSWLHDENPYDMRVVEHTLELAGDRRPLPDTEPPPSVYLPTALPVIAAGEAWLSWIPARMLWCILSVAAFASSLLLIFRNVKVRASAGWLLAAAVLFFSPVSSGLSTGNPSVLSCSLTMLAVYLVMTKRPVWCALALGLAHCVKPQISICAVALLALWSCWKPLLLSFVVPAISGALSLLRASSIAEYRLWLASLHDGTIAALAAGALNDPRPSNPFSYHLVNSGAILGVFVPDVMLENLIAVVAAAVMAAFYLVVRRRASGDRRWRDMAFFSAVTLTLVYHRYYDAQLLLMAFPFVVRSICEPARNSRRWTVIGVFCCLLVLEFPTQAFAAGLATRFPVDHSMLGFLLFRHQPFAILTICVLLIAGNWRDGTALKTASNRGESEPDRLERLS